MSYATIVVIPLPTPPGKTRSKRSLGERQASVHYDVCYDVPWHIYGSGATFGEDGRMGE
ncbi:hypothetical protein AG1IA_00522 [Rhizoctonia solani AG-1 IA]|uniref:Uncharacterized protein n=1 Tax=Thanatephorus cucumeris (strain AG1-IA) TaxID=983506 RepID=L8X5H3_THACA|nr:hypothetical protein AG1IA_00522 [Rhizoctonia solani AG-1 IA]